MNAVSILSPHFDDAAFSLSFALTRWTERNVRVRVINFYTRSAYGPGIAVSDPGRISDIRKREDRRALSRISSEIRITNLGLVDAPLRLGIDWNTVCSPESQPFVTETEETLLDTRLRLPTGLVIAPLALGNHVDHMIVHRWATHRVARNRLAFYEDLPYATWTGENLIRERVQSAEEQARTNLRAAFVCGPKTAAITYKRRVAGEYRSQVTKKDAALMAGFSKKYGGTERIWIPRHNWNWMSVTS